MRAQERIYIETQEAEYSYRAGAGPVQEVKALGGVDLRIGKGEFVAIVGGNGSGKTTFARLLNGLLLPTRGTVYIDGLDSKDGEHLWEIRRTVGMVFQNPDNQIVGTTVEEDVAFGPENLGLPSELIKHRVRDALRSVGMEEHADAAPHLLSGGQKQLVSIAGIIAMKPECLILDEATAFLDPAARKEIMQVVRRLNREEGITVLYITHNMEEAAQADRLIVLDAGCVVLDGEPREILPQISRSRDLGLTSPQVSELFDRLREEGFNLPAVVLNVDEAVAALMTMYAESGYADHKA